jgi:hypothetical protein
MVKFNIAKKAQKAMKYSGWLNKVGGVGTQEVVILAQAGI